MSVSIDHIEAIAKQCRTDLEQGTIPPSLLKKLFLRQFPKAESYIDEHLGLFMPHFPHGNAIAGSLLVRHALHGRGKLVEGFFENFNNKQWFLNIGRTALGRDTIVDITADQFEGGPTVYVGPLYEPWQALHTHAQSYPKPEPAPSPLVTQSVPFAPTLTRS